MVEPKTALKIMEESDENSWRVPLLLSSQEEHFMLKLGLTEIVGEAGVGKTQIALSACVSCACMQRDASQTFGKAMYVSMGEGATQQTIARRLDQMAKGRKSENNTNQAANSILNRIITRFTQNQDDFEHLVFHDLPDFLENDCSVGLLVLDSIASMFRINETKDEAFAIYRSGLLFQRSIIFQLLSLIK